jgi:glycerol-3-phosphate dehydrogenase subunit C
LLPKQPPALSPRDPRYWDANDLAQEQSRVFAVCDECRLCRNFCSVFPALFERIEGRAKLREPAALGLAESGEIDALCFQCKACHYRCPYTAQDGHPYAIDFPQLMLRQRAQRAARQTCHPPEHGAEAASTAIAAAPSPMDAIVLFTAPCPSAGDAPTARALSQVLGHHGMRLELASAQACCGVPQLGVGDVAAATELAAQNLDALWPHVARGLDVITPSPTCSYALRHEYPRLLGTPEASMLAAHSFDAMDYLRTRLLRAHRLRTDFQRALGRVALHVPCHLRAQRVGTPGESILGKVPDTQLEVIEHCAAVGSSWGLGPEQAELNRTYARKLMKTLVSAHDWTAIASDCPLAAQRIAEELHTGVVHPLELLNAAYGLPPTRELGGAP